MNREGWRYLPFDSSSTGRQLALSESLLTVSPTLPSLYWYTAESPSLILGAAQSLKSLDPSTSYPVYKRTSGGATVLAGPDFLSLDVLLPPTSRLWQSDITAAYRWLGQTWLATLNRLGLATRLIEPAEARAAKAVLESLPLPARLLRLVCFGTLSSYEVVDRHGRKLVGLAQIKRRNGNLFQCGLPLHWPAGEFACCFALSADEQAQLTLLLTERATGLDDLLGWRPPIETIIKAFETSLTELWPVELQLGAWTEAELALAGKLQAEKFCPVI